MALTVGKCSRIEISSSLSFRTFYPKSKTKALFWTLNVFLLMMSICVPAVTSQIEDIILDLEDPNDYVDEVVASMEREQAERERQQVEAAARCRVRCLSNRQRDSSLPNSSQNRVSLERCLREEDCTSCLKPCSQPFVNLAFCKHICQGDARQTCEDSCQFLQSVYTQKPGQCPTIQRLTGYGAVCIEACLADSDCPEEEQKCCYNGCGHVCAHPAPTVIGVPVVPDKPEMTEIRPEGAVILEWNSVATNATGPVLYIVWVRWNVGKHHSDAHMTHWQQIAQTTELSTVIRDISPGHWYQYQVSAVNINGTQGASQETQPFCLAREPTPPGVPSNLTEGDTLIQGNHVTVSVQWKPPVQSDLPVTRYKIFWSKRLSKHPTTEEKEHRQVVQGDQLQFDVPDLDPESTYLVQVQAICQYGDSRLKSEKASIYLNTYPLSRAAQLVLTTTLAVNIEELPTPPSLTAVRVEHSFFRNGLLRANVSWSVIQDGSGVQVQKALLQWSPEACIADSSLDNGLPKLLTATTQDQHFVIYELRFDCRYVVRVRPISDQGAMGSESRMSFVTPSCGEVIITGMVHPDCPSSVPRVPEEPANLHHSFIINAVNISAHLTWDPPLSDSPVTAYRVTWGQTLQTSPNVWDKNTVLTKVLSKDSRSFQLQNLCEAVTYLVRIQALSRIGPGKVAMVHFTAPVLTVTTQRDPTSSLFTPYKIIREPPDTENHLGRFPVTAHPPSSWGSGGGAPSRRSSSMILYFFCLVLCILANSYVRAAVHISTEDDATRKIGSVDFFQEKRERSVIADVERSKNHSSNNRVRNNTWKGEIR